MRWLAILFVLLLSGCVTKMDKAGQTSSTVDVKYLAKSEVDRIAEVNRAEVIDGLMLIAEKLYRRNPREWKKSGVDSRDDALARLVYRKDQPLPELGGAREGRAAALAFSDKYKGDRVAALMYGLLTMADAAFDHKEEYFILDALNEKKLFNCARNMEIAVWKLGNDRDAAGELFLLSNELDPARRNLSYEREFGRLMGLLDFMAKIVADRNGRTLSRVSHAMISAIFLPVGFLK